MKSLFLRGQKGMVLVIVIVAIMMMSVVVVGILTRNVSGSLRDEKGIQRLQAELLAKGGFWLVYENLGTAPTSFSETVGSTTFTVTYTTVAGAGPSGTTEVVTQVDY